MKTTRAGTRLDRSRDRTSSHSSASDGAGSEATTNTATSSPHSRLAIPTAAASSTRSWPSSTSSISPGDRFSPPRMMMSSSRPSRYR